MNKEPCSICELYVKGEKCEQESGCPVGMMKKENRSLKNRNTRLQKKLDKYSWGTPRELKRNDMGW